MNKLIFIHHLFAIFLITHVCYSQTNNGFIIGENVNIRETGNVKGNLVKKVNGNQKVEIIQLSENRDGLGNTDRCEMYPWVKVKWSSDSTGWVYGKYIYQINETGNFIKPGVVLNIKNEYYKFGYAVNYSYPSIDSEGLTDCIPEHFLVMYNANDKSYFLIENDVIENGYKFVNLFSNYGIDEKLTDAKSENEKYYLRISQNYQEGCSFRIIYIQKTGKDKFKVSSYFQSEETFYGNECE